MAPQSTPFRNSPSVDSLSPRIGGLDTPHQGRQASEGRHLSTYPSLSASADQLQMTGNPGDGSEVPVDLLRSVMLALPVSAPDITTNAEIPETPPIGTTGPLASPVSLSNCTSMRDHQLSIAAQWTQTVAYTPAQSFPPVKHLPGYERKRILVTGGAGFVGSHLVSFVKLMSAMIFNLHRIDKSLLTI